MSSDARADRAHRAGDERSRAPVRLLPRARSGGLAGFHETPTPVFAAACWTSVASASRCSSDGAAATVWTGRRAVAGASAPRLRARIRRRRGRADRRHRRGRPPCARAAAASGRARPLRERRSRPRRQPAQAHRLRGPRCLEQAGTALESCRGCAAGSARRARARARNGGAVARRRQSGLRRGCGLRRARGNRQVESARGGSDRGGRPARTVGAGGELERELPFGIVRQLLESTVVAAEAEEREALLAGAAALATPVLFPADPEAGAEPSFSALHGLYWLDVNLADAQPLLVAVDDAHWADVDSLRWLIYLARRLAGVPLALVLTTRPAEAGPVQELLDELLVDPRDRGPAAGRAERAGDRDARSTAAGRGARSELRHRLPAGDRWQPVLARGALRRARPAGGSRRVARTPAWPAS